MIDEITLSAAGEMVTMGNEQLADIQGHIDQLQTQIEAARADLALIAEERTRQTACFEEAHAATHQLEDAYQLAKRYAGLGVGTQNEHNGTLEVGATKRAWQQSKKALDHLKKQLDEINATHDEHVKAVTLTLFELDTRQAELQAVQKGMHRAKDELGQETFDQALARYQEKCEQILAMKSAIVDAELELEAIHLNNLQELAPWPALQKEVAALQLYEDENTRMMEANHHYLETFLSVASVVDEFPPEFRKDHIGLTFWDCAMTDPSHVIAARRNQVYLKSKRAYVENALQAYRNWRRKG
jgi:chromosome segregation ATPase